MTTPLTLVYDGDCGLCRACVRWVERRDGAKRITTMPSSSCTWSDAATLPFADTVVVRLADGQTFLRSSAVAVTWRSLPGMWRIVGALVLSLNAVGPLRWAFDALYDLVARNRRLISNGLVRVGLLDASCRIEKA